MESSNVETVPGKHWHHDQADEVVELLDSNSEKGLDLLEVLERREHFGPNTVPARKGQGPLVRFLLQFHQPLGYCSLTCPS